MYLTQKLRVNAQDSVIHCNIELIKVRYFRCDHHEKCVSTLRARAVANIYAHTAADGMMYL